MKKFLQIFGLIIITSLFSCNKEEIANLKKTDILDAPLDPFIAENYIEDAKTIYFNEIKADVNHPNYNNPTLDNAEIEKILSLIKAVYDLDTPERDSVFVRYKIHMYCQANLREFALSVDPNAQAIKNLRGGIIPTGNTELDNIFATYPVESVRDFFQDYYSLVPALIIRTQQDYNFIPILKLFKGIPEIKNSDLYTNCVGDGDNIILKRDADDYILTFIHGMGDCPSGCTEGIGWEFKIKNGVATYIPYDPVMKL